MRIKQQRGFTLIELIVVFTVLAILSTIGSVSFIGYSRVQALNQATNDLVSTLNTARALSASQLKTLDKNGYSNGCSDNAQSLNGYGVSINTGQRFYQLYIRCIINGVPFPITDDRWKTPLPSNAISFDATTNISDVFFPVISGGMLTTGTGPADTITLASYSHTKKISIKQGYITILP